MIDRDATYMDANCVVWLGEYLIDAQDGDTTLDDGTREITDEETLSIIDLLLAEGQSHITSADIERKRNEV